MSAKLVHHYFAQLYSHNQLYLPIACWPIMHRMYSNFWSCFS